MIFCSNEQIEVLYVHENDNTDETHWIDITTSDDGMVFTVECCCDDEWSWDFVYNRTNYELIKYLIMDCIAECNTMQELILALNEVFETSCEDMVVHETELKEDEFECDGDCKNCNFYEEVYFTLKQ